MNIYIYILFLLITCSTTFKKVTAQILTETNNDSIIYDYELRYRASKTRYFDLIHTKLDLSFDWNKQYVFGIANLTLTPYFYPQSELILDAKGMDIYHILIKKDTSYLKVDFDYNGNQLTINFIQEFNKKDTIEIRIHYTAKPNELNGNDAISEDKGLYFINPLNKEIGKPQQIWTTGQTESNSSWFPTINNPNERCTQEMYITVQSRFKTLSNGIMIYSTDNGNGTKTDYWKMDKPHAPYLFMIAIGEFAVVKDTWNNIPLTYWVEPEFEQYAKDIFGNTPEMMEFFSKLLGYDFPWSKYAQIVVRDFVSGAMENTTASVFMEDLHKNKRELKDENWDYIIAHELFHQWFGNLVTTESWANLTLNEGFAEYSEYLWNEYKYGDDKANYNLLYTKEDYLLEAEEEKKYLVRYYYESHEDMFDSHSYSKGALVLHMLRNYLGDEAFFTSLNIYLNKHAFGAVEINNLRLVFEQVTGEDLNWFFTQWYLSKGHPILDIHHEYKSDTLYLNIDQIQDLENVPVFQLPVFVDIWVENKKRSFPIIITEESEQYKFPLTQKPQLVNFDGEKQLLAEVQHKKSEQELLFQYTHTTNIISQFDVLYELNILNNDSIKTALINLALNDPFYGIRKEVISYITENEYKIKEFLPKILALSKDKNSEVRSEAITFLAFNNFKKQKSIIYKALQDESYLVIAAALNSITENKNIKLSDAQIKSLESINNVDVVLSLAEYFSKQKNTFKYSWYKEKLTKLTGNQLFYFIQYFSEFLMEAPQENREKSISIFENLSRTHNNYIVRLSAFQALLLMSDIKGVNKKIKSIKKNEKDKRLKEIYKDI